MIGAIDCWVGRTLFVPLIIRVCQRLRISQYRFHNYGWLIGAYLQLAAAMAKGEGQSLAFAIALVLTILYGRNLDHQGHDSPAMRWFLLVGNVVHIAAHVTGRHILFCGPNWDLSCPILLIWLAAEYARTIKTIPPPEERKPASQQMVEAKARRI